MKQNLSQTNDNFKELLTILPMVNWDEVIREGRLPQVLKLMVSTVFSGLLYLFFVMIPRGLMTAWERLKNR